MRQGATYHLLGTVVKALHQSQNRSYQPQHKIRENHQQITRLGRKWCNSLAHQMPFAGYCSRPREHPSLWGQTVVMHDVRTPQWTYNRSVWAQGMTAPLSWSWAQAILWLMQTLIRSIVIDLCMTTSPGYSICVHSNSHLSCHRKSLCLQSHSRTRHVMWWCSSMVLV